MCEMCGKPHTEALFVSVVQAGKLASAGFKMHLCVICQVKASGYIAENVRKSIVRLKSGTARIRSYGK